MSNIPKAREELKALALELTGSKRHRLQTIIAAYLYRDPPCRRAPVKPTPISAATKAGIKRMAASNPKMHIREIAELYCLNQGRVSEILNGKR